MFLPRLRCESARLNHSEESVQTIHSLAIQTPLPRRDRTPPSYSQNTRQQSPNMRELTWNNERERDIICLNDSLRMWESRMRRSRIVSVAGKRQTHVACCSATNKHMMERDWHAFVCVTYAFCMLRTTWYKISSLYVRQLVFACEWIIAPFQIMCTFWIAIDRSLMAFYCVVWICSAAGMSDLSKPAMHEQLICCYWLVS